MSLFKAMARVFSPGTYAKHEARVANAVGRLNNEAQRITRRINNQNTAETAKLNRWIADAQNRRLVRAAMEAQTAVYDRYNHDLKQARRSAAAQAEAAFEEGLAASNQSATPVYHALEVAARKAHAIHQDANIDRTALVKGLTAAQQSGLAGDYASQMLELDKTQDVFNEVKAEGGGIIADLFRAGAAVFTKGRSLALDGMMGYQQTSQQAAEVMQKAYNGLYGEGVRRYNPPPIVDAQAVYGLAMGAYEAFRSKPAESYGQVNRPTRTTPTPRKYR